MMAGPAMLPLQTVQSEILANLPGQKTRGEIGLVIAPMRRATRWLYGVRLALLSLLFVLTTAFAAMSWRSWQIDGSVHPALLIGLLIMLAAVAIWPLVQHNAYFASRLLPKGTAIAELYEQFAILADNRQLVTAQGDMVDSRLFRSALSPLLMSNDPSDHKLVRTPLNRCYRQALLVLPLDDKVGIQPIDQEEFGRTEKRLVERAVEGPTNGVSRFKLEATAEGLSTRRRNGTSSKYAERIRGLGLDRVEMLRRIALLNPPQADGRREAMTKLALTIALPVLLESDERGVFAHAIKCAGSAVRKQYGQAGATSDSDDWIRKLIAPPKPWLIDQLSKPPEQAELAFTSRPHP